MIPIGTSVPLRDVSAAVIGLIFANAAMFLVQSGLPVDLAKQFIQHNALIPARYFDPGFAPAHGLVRHNYWPLLTSQFMHAGWLHLIVNMWTLWVIGRPLEQRIGTFRFILFYLVCGLFADAAHIAANPDSTIPALGASGAIAGILGGYAISYPVSRVHLLTPVLFFPVIYRLPALIYVVIWFAIQVFEWYADQAMGAAKGGIAWWAHIGGFIAGVGLVKVIGPARRKIRDIDITPAAVGGRGVAQAGGRTIGAIRGRKFTVGADQRPRRSRKPSPRRTKQREPAGESRWKSAVAAFDRFKQEAGLGSGPDAPNDTPRTATGTALDHAFGGARVREGEAAYSGDTIWKRAAAQLGDRQAKSADGGRTTAMPRSSVPAAGRRARRSIIPTAGSRGT